MIRRGHHGMGDSPLFLIKSVSGEICKKKGTVPGLSKTRKEILRSRMMASIAKPSANKRSRRTFDATWHQPVWTSPGFGFPS
jgi:hypothetical protein